MIADVATWAREHFTVAEERGAEITVRCPFHNDTHPSAGVNTEKASFHCFACGEAVPGKLSEVALRLGWDAPPIGGNGHAGPEAEYLYRDAQGKLLAIKRRLPPKEPGKKNMVWYDAHGEPGLRGKGIVVLLYRLPELTAALEARQVVAVVEGEKDADRVTAAGICATTCPGGAGQWRQIDTDVFPAGAEVLLFWDADVPGMRHRDMVGKALAERGCTVKVVDLGFEVTADHGKDVSDWLADPFREPDDFLELVKAAKPWGEKDAPCYELTTIAQLFEAPPPEPLIDDVLDKNTLNTIGSLSGVGKSFLLGELAVACATGRPFLGHFEVCATGPVLIVDQENSASDLAVRLRAMGVTTSTSISFLHFAGVKLDVDESFGRLANTVRKLRPVLVGFDALIRFHSGEESESTDMAPVMERFRALVNLGTTVVILHHHGWTAERGRGSTDIQAAVDFEYKLVRAGEESDPYLVFSSVKARRAPIEPFKLKLEAQGSTARLRYIGEVHAEARDVETEILTCLAEGAKTYQEIQSWLAGSELAVGEKRLRSILRDMVSHETLSTDARGKTHAKVYSRLVVPSEEPPSDKRGSNSSLGARPFLRAPSEESPENRRKGTDTPPSEAPSEGQESGDEQLF